MNTLYIGDIEIDLRGLRKYLFIGDEIPDIKGAQVFDLSKHSLNPLQRGITHKQARGLADALYAIYPQGENTLTVRNGRIALPPALMKARRLDLVEGSEEIDVLISDLTFSPLIQKVLCNRTNFSFTTTKVTLVRLNRAEIGDFDALVLGLVLINHFKGQIILSDAGFYLRNGHINLVRENRLIAQVRSLRELPLHLKDTALVLMDKVPHRVLYRDAVELAENAGLRPDFLREDNEYNKFIDRVMGLAPRG